jgi:hypothetical protein
MRVPALKKRHKKRLKYCEKTATGAPRGTSLIGASHLQNAALILV